MSLATTVQQNGSSLITNYDSSKIFLGGNRNRTGTFLNTLGEDITIPAGTLMGKVTKLTSAGGAYEVATVTVAGTIGASGAGNAKAIVTGLLVTGSPLTITFAVANNDTATQVAGKARTALAVAAITGNYTIGGTGAVITLTANAKATNDETLEIEVTNDTSVGLTDVVSTITTEGVISPDINVIGNLLPYDSVGNNGENIPVGVLHYPIMVEAGASLDNVSYCFAGDFDVTKLTLNNPADTLDTVVLGEAIREQITSNTQLVGVPVSAMTGFDNQPL
jgi:hypothetical protein